MSSLKPGSDRIYHHIQYLKNQPWLTEAQRYWPSHLFHFTDIDNALNILSDGFLFSRVELEKRGELKTDIASPEIIESTPPKWKDFVRLYFRPRTPMQYRNEGIRPGDKIELNAHCPIPIFFIFDAEKILTLQATQFSNGNLRTREVVVDNRVDFYLSLPFQDIYHDTWFPSSMDDEEKRKIKFHRQAEVIIPRSMDLSSLKYICCRSQAEFETLIARLPSDVCARWKDKIGIDKRNLLFFCEWLYIEKVSLSSSNIIFDFNQTDHSGPFHARLEIEEVETNERYVWEEGNFTAEKTLEFDLSNLDYPEHYKVLFFLDSKLVYQNTYRQDAGLLF